MQQVAANPRSDMETSDVEALIRDAPALKRGRWLEVLDRSLNIVDVVSELEDGSIRRNSYADNHATASLKIGRELDWGAGIVRPVTTLSDGVTTAAFRLGAYFLPTPVKSFARSPATFDVECVDILDALSGGVNDSFSLATGTPVLQAVEDVLLLMGYTQYVIDQTAVAETVQSPGYTRPITDAPTWRGIVNDLLGMVGYAGVWSDWDGRLRCEPYLRPVDRSIEWTYTTHPVTGMIQNDRELEDDYYAVPNAWTFYRNNLEEGFVPTIGNGVYTFTNLSNGRSSVEARGGRIVSAPAEGLESTSQESLEAAAQSKIDADMALVRRLNAATDPNPLHWHFDVCWVDDPAIGTPFRALVTEWVYPLRGKTMSHTWTVVE